MNSLVPQHVTDVLRGMWQGRWTGLAVAWLTAMAGTALVFLVPDRYEATARVYVDTQSLLKPLLQGLTVQPNVEQEVSILSRTLISRPNLEKLARMTDLDLAATTPEAREKLLDGLAHQVYIKVVGQNLYIIGFAHQDRAQATRVVQSLLSIFVESGLAPKAKDTGQAQRFIEEQIKQYEQKLSEAENRLKEFKLKNLDLNVPQGRDFFGSMATLTESLQDARLLLQEAEKSRDALKQQITDEEERPPVLIGALADGAAAVATPELDARIATLSKNLDEMLLRFTDNHPDVLNTRRVIKEAEAQREHERKRLAEEQERRRRASGASTQSAAYPQLKLAMAESEAQVARLRARVSEQEQRLEKLRLVARYVPEREAQLTQLNRDYAIQKQNYDALVTRRESALMSGEVQAATGVATFRIVDPPQVSPNPVAPNRKMLVIAALLVSLLAGIGASYLSSLLHPTFHDGRGLKKFTQRPVLGTVSLISTPAVLSRRRRSTFAFLSGVGGLGAAYAGVLAVVFFRALLPF
ncbi:MAG TPA: XrtA system polysaccharide chain length determinant [Burkholderiales bacterium]|jgi:polysaccharide chain length determinant protein (PEP-CTERM system associated)|nr:XrtA system polysaccharide chain length determinant [Burkholderiales bacterium]